MPTPRFARLVGIPERTYRRWQQRARQGRPPKGPWPTPVRAAPRDVIIELATRHPAWGQRMIWAMARHVGHRISQRTVARLLDAEGLVLKADYQRERRELAKASKAAFAAPPTGPNQVWQLDFSEYETNAGGTWRVAGIADYWSKYEFGWHWSPTANQYDAIAAVELALAEAQHLLGNTPPVEHLADPDTGEIIPITLVTDNGEFADDLLGRVPSSSGHHGRGMHCCATCWGVGSTSWRSAPSCIGAVSPNVGCPSYSSRHARACMRGCQSSPPRSAIVVRKCCLVFAAGLGGPLAVSNVVVAEPFEAVVADLPIGDHGRASFDVGSQEGA